MLRAVPIPGVHRKDDRLLDARGALAERANLTAELLERDELVVHPLAQVLELRGVPGDFLLNLPGEP